MNEIAPPQPDAHPLYERVELITHLLKFSDRMFAIMSPVTDELQEFADFLVETGGPGLLFARAHPHLALHVEDMANDLAREWGVEVDLGESAQQAIEQRLAALIPEPRRAVAIIEDVERLPHSALDELVGFMQRLDRQTGGRVRLVLLGGPRLTGLLQQLSSMGDGGQVYSLNLTPPTELNEPAAEPTPEPEPLASAAPSVEPTRQGAGLPGRTLLIGGIALSLTLAVIIALLMRPAENERPTNDQLSIPLQPSPAPAQPVAAPVVGETIPQPAPIGHQLAESPAQPTPLPVQPAPVPVPVPATIASQPDGAPMVQEPASEPVTSASQAAVEKQAAPAAPEKTAAPAVAEKPAVPAAPTKPVATAANKTGSWYAQQKGDQYVLQVVSLKSGADIEQFVARHGLKDCHSFRQAVYGQTLHTLTCGLFPSRDAAIQAAAQLPEQARPGKPFPRRIDDIRKIMLP